MGAVFLPEGLVNLMPRNLPGSRPHSKKGCCWFWWLGYSRCLVLVCPRFSLCKIKFLWMFEKRIYPSNIHTSMTNKENDDQMMIQWWLMVSNEICWCPNTFRPWDHGATINQRCKGMVPAPYVAFWGKGWAHWLGARLPQLVRLLWLVGRSISCEFMSKSPEKVTQVITRRNGRIYELSHWWSTSGAGLTLTTIVLGNRSLPWTSLNAHEHQDTYHYYSVYIYGIGWTVFYFEY